MGRKKGKSRKGKATKKRKLVSGVTVKAVNNRTLQAIIGFTKYLVAAFL